MAASKSKADETPTPEEAAREAVEEASPKEGEEKYPVEQLIAESPSLTSYPAHVVAGALDGVNKKTLTVTETKKACAAWLKSPAEDPTQEVA